MYAVPEGAGVAGTGVCADVTAVAHARVRCNDAARLATGPCAWHHQRSRDRCRLFVSRCCCWMHAAKALADDTEQWLHDTWLKRDGHDKKLHHPRVPL